jgi:hypothetical protein
MFPCSWLTPVPRYHLAWHGLCLTMQRLDGAREWPIRRWLWPSWSALAWPPGVHGGGHTAVAEACHFHRPNEVDRVHVGNLCGEQLQAHLENRWCILETLKTRLQSQAIMTWAKLRDFSPLIFYSLCMIQLQSLLLLIRDFDTWVPCLYLFEQVHMSIFKMVGAVWASDDLRG